VGAGLHAPFEFGIGRLEFGRHAVELLGQHFQFVAGVGAHGAAEVAAGHLAGGIDQGVDGPGDALHPGGHHQRGHDDPQRQQQGQQRGIIAQRGHQGRPIFLDDQPPLGVGDGAIAGQHVGAVGRGGAQRARFPRQRQIGHGVVVEILPGLVAATPSMMWALPLRSSRSRTSVP